MWVGILPFEIPRYTLLYGDGTVLALSPVMMTTLLLSSSALVTLAIVCALSVYDFATEMGEVIGLALLSDEALSLLDEDQHAMWAAWTPSLAVAVALQPYLFVNLTKNPSPALLAHLVKFTNTTRASNNNNKTKFTTVKVAKAKPVDRHAAELIKECASCWTPPPSLELADTIRATQGVPRIAPTPLHRASQWQRDAEMI